MNKRFCAELFERKSAAPAHQVQQLLHSGFVCPPLLLRPVEALHPSACDVDVQAAQRHIQYVAELLQTPYPIHSIGPLHDAAAELCRKGVTQLVERRPAAR